MNHIARLTAERDDARETIRAARDALLEVTSISPKFHGPDNDYVHLRTDILPKIEAIRFSLCGR